MEQYLNRVQQAPKWIQQFSDEIDTLKFGPGFDAIGDATPWNFGVTTGNGREEMKKLFLHIDGILDTKHRLLECWSGDDIHIVRGEANLVPKDGSKSELVDPFVWIFYMSSGKPSQLDRLFIVNGPVQTQKIL